MCNSLARSAIFRLFLFVGKSAFFLWLFHLRDLGYNWKAVQGSNFFEFNGKTLYQIKKDLEDDEPEEFEEEII